MILEPGTFNVNLYRKAIPPAVKVQVLLNRFQHWLALIRSGSSVNIDADFPFHDAANVQFDHNPALTNRPYDTIAGDFIPPQNDPNHICALDKHIHLQKTTGRAPGAERTVTTRGSDVGERARTSDIRARQAVHDARIAAKHGRHDEAAEILGRVKFKKKHTRPKQKIPQRKNPWGTVKRKLGARKK